MHAISKRYGRQAALRTVDFTGESGSVVALLGANGAGKTTLLRIIATLTQQDRGEYRAFGVDAWPRRREVRSRLGYVGHRPFIYPELTCAENIGFFARLFQLADNGELVRNALDHVGLLERADRPASSLSRGLLQRLDLARATLHDPSLLVLDEPDTGLDVAGRDLLLQLMRERAGKGCLVIFTSHALDFAIDASDRIVTLVNGEIVSDDPSASITIAGLEATIHGRRQAVSIA
ncbi:MAG: heme ABC exporter ATP-binding protein CcmA [Thermomicrobiales bacterium]